MPNNRTRSRRAELIDARIAQLKSDGKHIVYLITEERDILENLMPELYSIYSLIPVKYRDNFRTVLPENLWTSLKREEILVDVYRVFKPCKEYIKSSGSETPLRLNKEKTTIFLLQDFHLFYRDSHRDGSIGAHLLRQFLDAAREQEENKQYWVLFLVSPVSAIPTGFEYDMEIIDIPEPEREEIACFLRKQEANALPDKALYHAAGDFCGLQMSEIRSIIEQLRGLYGTFCDPSAPNGAEIEKTRRALVAGRKKAAALRDRTVTILETGGRVAGMQGAVSWIRDDVRPYFMDPENAAKKGIDPPKGVLIAGLPGTGKTQLAKQVADDFSHYKDRQATSVPLVQFRMDNLLGGLVGDSEANFKRCRKRIEALAPCVVLIDEIEKTFDTKEKNNNSEVKMNILSALLDWMQDNQKQIFFYATCNSISLPPELQRDGRFSMRYSAFMPSKSELAEIIIYHLKRANDRKHADGNLFLLKDREPETVYRNMAERFLEEITEYAKAAGEYRFYTGANIENLIQQTNVGMDKDAGQSMPYTPDQYLKKMLETAKSSKSQPYGMTNRRDIAVFWLKALENKYVDVGENPLFPFEKFDLKEGKFHFDQNHLCSYDRYLRECIAGEIEELYQNNYQKKERM